MQQECNFQCLSSEVSSFKLFCAVGKDRWLLPFTLEMAFFVFFRVKGASFSSVKKTELWNTRNIETAAVIGSMWCFLESLTEVPAVIVTHQSSHYQHTYQLDDAPWHCSGLVASLRYLLVSQWSICRSGVLLFLMHSFGNYFGSSKMIF